MEVSFFPLGYFSAFLDHKIGPFAWLLLRLPISLLFSLYLLFFLPSSLWEWTGQIQSQWLPDVWEDHDIWVEAQVQPVGFFHWLQDTRLAGKCETTGFIFLSERAHTLPSALLLVLSRCEQTDLRRPPLHQPVPWNKRRDSLTAGLCAGEHRRRPSGHYSRECSAWAGCPSVTIKKLCASFQTPCPPASPTEKT